MIFYLGFCKITYLLRTSGLFISEKALNNYNENLYQSFEKKKKSERIYVRNFFLIGIIQYSFRRIKNILCKEFCPSSLYRLKETFQKNNYGSN